MIGLFATTEKYKKEQAKLDVGRTKAGAKFLDKHHPLWYNQVNVEYLDMEDCEMCVLGQLYGHFTEGRLQLKISDCNNLGFYASTKLWKKEIGNRLNDNTTG